MKNNRSDEGPTRHKADRTITGRKSERTIAPHHASKEDSGRATSNDISLRSSDASKGWEACCLNHEGPTSYKADRTITIRESGRTIAPHHASKEDAGRAT